MSDGYYDPHPRIRLDRPLVLVGHPGAGVDQVGRILTGVTGLVFNDVARSAEASAGCSRAKLLLEQGRAALLAAEADALDRAVRRLPHGVIVAESGLVEDAARREWLFARTRVVYVQRPEEVLLARIQRSVADEPGRLPDFVMGAPRSVAQLRDHLARAEEAVLSIPVVVEAGDDPAGTVAQAVRASLDQLVGVERLSG